MGRRIGPQASSDGITQPARAKENSPPIYRWVAKPAALSPIRDERKSSQWLSRSSFVPGGTRSAPSSGPSVETLGYVHLSLRDKTAALRLLSGACFCTDPLRIAPAPAPEASQRTQWPGLDRFYAQEARQFVRQFLRAAITAVRLFLEAFEADGFQIARHAGIERAGAD